MDIKLQGDKAGAVSVSEAVFACDFNEALIHQVVTAYLAKARAGTSAQRTRSEVSGGGRKPWRQKGSGRARAGTIRSPLWRGGGVTFAAKTRDYSQKVNRKMYRSALRSILSELIKQERLIVVGDISVEQPKTKVLAEKLKALNLSDVLIVTETFNENVYLSARNLMNIGVLTVDEVNPVDFIRYKNVLMTSSAIKILEEKLS